MSEYTLVFVYIVLDSILFLWTYLFIISIKSFLKISSLKLGTNRAKITGYNTSKIKKTMLTKLPRFPPISRDYFHDIETKNQNTSFLPFVSVIVPARNEEEVIERCLISILKRNYLSFEVIAIDDTSCDSSFEIMKKVKEKMPGISDKLTILSPADYEKKPDDGLVKHGYQKKHLKRAEEN
jgi:cellulose synthase/poly-beta-1,6-N-acetylglucosamine synthase-like glycosyltransferase